MDGNDYKVGDVIVFATEEDSENAQEFWVLHASRRHHDGYMECDKLAVCDTVQMAELIGSLLKAYTNNGNALPTTTDLV